MEGVERKRTEQKGREAILERIRAAQPKRGVETSGGVPSGIFAPIEDPMLRFRQECQGNLTELIETGDAAESAAAIGRVLASLPDGGVYAQDDVRVRKVLEMGANGRRLMWSSAHAVPENAQATVTLAEALVAQTGSVLSSSACGGRGASAVPPCHIVYATRSQLVPDVESALRLVQKNQMNERSSYVGLITGSSRTADIEKILVQGAHGPRRLVVVLEA